MKTPSNFDSEEKLKKISRRLSDIQSAVGAAIFFSFLSTCGHCGHCVKNNPPTTQQIANEVIKRINQQGEICITEGTNNERTLK